MPSRSFQIRGADPTDPRAVASARAFNDATYADQLQQQYDRNAGWRRTKGIFRAIGIGVPTGFALAPGGALSSLYSSAAPAASTSTSAGWSMPGVTAPTFGAPASTAAATTGATSAGRFATMGRLFNSPGMELGVNSALNLFGMRSQNRANDQARQDALLQYREGLALERQRLEQEMQNAALDREDARALNAAVNELKRRELEADEEQRSFERGLVEARETRLAPYRETSAAAMNRLRAMWGLG